MPSPKFKTDLQTVIYRYFAESARKLKKIQHSIRSAEADLMVVYDGEEPRADDLKAVSEEFGDKVEEFCSWTNAGRTEAGLRLKEISDKEASDDNVEMLMGGAALGTLGAAGGYTTGLALFASQLAPTALFGAALGFGAALVGMPRFRNHIGSCGAPRKTPFDGVMSSWDETALAEKELVAFLPSLTQGFHNLSYKQALEKAQELRSELDRFLQLLQMEGLIFDPCSMSPGFQRAPGHVGRNL